MRLQDAGRRLVVGPVSMCAHLFQRSCLVAPAVGAPHACAVQATLAPLLALVVHQLARLLIRAVVKHLAPGRGRLAYIRQTAACASSWPPDSHHTLSMAPVSRQKAPVSRRKAGYPYATARLCLHVHLKMQAIAWLTCALMHGRLHAPCPCTKGHPPNLQAV